MLPSDVLGLDLGSNRTGFAYGPVGRTPQSGVVVLRKADEHESIAYSNLLAFLAQRFSAGPPRMVVKEAPLPVAAFAREGSAQSLVITYGMHAVCEAACVRFGVEFYNAADSTVRKHFIGVGRTGSRRATKAMVIARCQQLGYISRDEADEDRADALATWDFACARLCREPPRYLSMFPPQPERPRRRS